MTGAEIADRLVAEWYAAGPPKPFDWEWHRIERRQRQEQLTGYNKTCVSDLQAMRAPIHADEARR